jgi:hypothetical protein
LIYINPAALRLIQKFHAQLCRVAPSKRWRQVGDEYDAIPFAHNVRVSNIEAAGGAEWYDGRTWVRVG